MTVTCRSCNATLTKSDLVNVEEEYSYVCRGEVYAELEDVPTGRQSEATKSSITITTYECTCGEEMTIETYT